MFKKFGRSGLRSPRLYLICLALFALASVVTGAYYLAAGEGVVLGGLML